MLSKFWSEVKAAPLRSLAVLIVLVVVMSVTGIYAYAGTYGLTVVLRRGGSLWYATGPDDPALTPSTRLALRGDAPLVMAGPINWRVLAEGFEVAELPAVSEGKEVDRLLLARVDPARFRLEVHNRPAGDREPSDWLQALGAVFVINGSYFSRTGTPDTPFKSQGIPLGPDDYDARHGAFVASAASAHVIDLAGGNWRDALTASSEAMVSYPMLIGADGRSRAKGDERWLANRSFVGEDRAGCIVLGTTADAFFSLSRLAVFLREAPLDLKLALNLGGGPVACQGVALGGYTRDFCGTTELAVHDGVLKRLASVIPNRRWGLPIVLAAVPR